MHVHNLYADENGQSHWRDITIDWAQEGPEGKTSARQAAYGIIFRQTQAEHDRPWHPAPRRQYIVNLDAGVELTASDGEARVIGAGEVILVEDTHGQGHLSKSVNSQMRHSIFIPLEEGR
jgi:hypothetical protein